MITTEEIAIKVRQMLIDGMGINTDYAENPDYQRKDYSKEGIIIVPRSIDARGLCVMVVSMSIFMCQTFRKAWDVARLFSIPILQGS